MAFAETWPQVAGIAAIGASVVGCVWACAWSAAQPGEPDPEGFVRPFELEDTDEVVGELLDAGDAREAGRRARPGG